MSFEDLEFKGYRCICRNLGEQELLIKINDLLKNGEEFWVLYLKQNKSKPNFSPWSLISNSESFVSQVFDNVQWESDMSGTLKPVTAIYVKI